MRTHHRQLIYTFGDLVEAVYAVFPKHKADAIVRQAVNGQVVVFRGQLRVVII
jgi:hypothetical protein